MTTAEIDELEKKWKASTQGEWHGNELGYLYCFPITLGDVNDLDDAYFIAAAHNAMPQLIQAAREAESLRAENLELRSQLSTLTKSP